MAAWDPLALEGQPVLVLGHGISGLAMARWCAHWGARVTLADSREQPERMAQLRAELPGVEVVAAPLDAVLAAGQNWALVAKSPGLSPAQLADLSQAAAQQGTPVLGELALWATGVRHVYAAAGWAPKVLAITGTNGKTTTTALTAHLLRRCGWRVAVAGNIGPALLDVLLDAWLRAKNPEKKTASSLSEQASHAPESEAAHVLPQAWVLELSSFQLDGVPLGEGGFEPTAAALLNLTQDHLDWHGSMAAYAQAKARVFGAAALQVLNRDDPAVAALAAEGHAQVWFGTDEPQRPLHWGLQEVHGMSWLVRAQAEPQAAQRPARGRKKTLAPVVPAGGGLTLQRLMPADALRIRGRHNAANALAALALATAAGAPLAPMLHGLREYRGEPHRVEPVAVVGEVEYIDDSKGTNVGATLAAICGLGAQQRLVVILGGEGKGQDFAPLAPAVAAHARAVVLIGRDAPRIRQALAQTGVPLHEAADMDAAVRQAAACARAGDAVLLSPACASLDMFRDYAHRAQAFVAAVQALALEAGQPVETGGAWA